MPQVSNNTPRNQTIECLSKEKSAIIVAPGKSENISLADALPSEFDRLARIPGVSVVFSDEEKDALEKQQADPKVKKEKPETEAEKKKREEKEAEEKKKTEKEAEDKRKQEERNRNR